MKDTGDGGETAKLPVPMVFTNPAVAPLYSDPQMKTKVKDLPAGSRMEPWGTCTIYGSYGMKLSMAPIPARPAMSTRRSSSRRARLAMHPSVRWSPRCALRSML